MFLDRDSAHPNAKNLPKKPWWLEHIDDLYRIEIVPCRLSYDDKGHEIVKPCDPQWVSLWVVYGHYSNGYSEGFRAIDDFDTKGEAQHFYNKMIDRFPHLTHHRVQTRPVFQRRSSTPCAHL